MARYRGTGDCAHPVFQIFYLQGKFMRALNMFYCPTCCAYITDDEVEELE